MKLFKKQHELEKKGKLQEFDPECAIFVCNKWDQVPPGEEVKVWDHIVKRLQANWPTRKDVNITNQMFKMSVAEVNLRQTNLTKPQFLSLINQFQYMISIARL